MNFHTAVLRLLLSAGFAVAAGAASAKDAATSSVPPLPGVEDGYSIVKPQPEPLEADPAAGSGQFRIGDMDVRISGRVIVDIGVGNVPLPHK